MSFNPTGLDRSALVAYGSETGNAYDCAEELGRQLERLHFSTSVCNLDTVTPLALANCTLCLLVVSTTGQGDLPNNARVFWSSLLRKKLSPSYLEGVRFTTFGLGDSSYPKFNWAARKLHKRLMQLGADEVYHRGEADEQHDGGFDASFVPWALDLHKDLLVQFPLPEGLIPIHEDVLLQPKWLLSQSRDSVSPRSDFLPNGDRLTNPVVNGSSMSKNEAGPIQSTKEDDMAGQFFVKLEENRRMTPRSHWQDVRHLILNSDSPVPYGPGDVLTVYPQNSTDTVDQLIDLMDWSAIADEVVEFHPTKTASSAYLYPLPPIFTSSQRLMTLRHLLTRYLDLTAIPRRSFFSLIAHFTDDQFHKDRLLEFTKPEYIDELYDYTTRPRRSILEVLQEFESVKIPWQWAATVLPELRGRQFSIASGGVLKQSPKGTARFELLVAIVNYRTVIKKVREGVCTRYLANLQPGSEIAVSIQRGGLGISKAEARRPVIMIGPGTGVAPMRSLIWERSQWAQDMDSCPNEAVNEHANGDGGIGKSLLFFGCRGQNSDYFYNDEWEDIGRKMPLDVFPAFSRDQNQKIYAQDVIQQHGAEVYDLLHNNGGSVYVCGSSGKMPIAVRAALVMAFQQNGDMDQQSSEKYLEQMEKERRYKQETW